MRTVWAVLLVLLLFFTATIASAGAEHRGDGNTNLTLTTKGVDPPAHWAPRQDRDDARFVITSENRDAELILTSDVVALQLTDRALKRVRRQLRSANDNADDNAGNPIGWFESAVLATVSSFLDQSAECPLHALRDVRYVDGRLEFTTTKGARLFEHMDVDSSDILGGFSENDARQFVTEFHRAKGSTR